MATAAYLELRATGTSVILTTVNPTDFTTGLNADAACVDGLLARHRAGGA
ncbi:hypothetical protein [Mycobacterium sp. E802]|nr:hypothetical protein [Mycobacterium sp. E802]